MEDKRREKINNDLSGDKEHPRRSTPRDRWEKKISYDLRHLRGSGGTTVWILKIHRATVSIKGSQKSFIVPSIEVLFCAGRSEHRARQKAGIKKTEESSFDILTNNMEKLEPKIIISGYKTVSLRKL